MRTKSILLAVFSLLFTSIVFSQSTSLQRVAIQDAEFPGGSAVLTKYIKEHLVIPDDYQGNSAVRVRFTIDENGKCKEVSTRNKIENCETCEQATISLIENMPNWKPAYSNNEKKNVATVMVLTVPFNK